MGVHTKLPRLVGWGACLALAALALAVPAAQAEDPGRWRETGVSKIPLNYYQGMTSDPQRNLFFDGIYTGLYRTDSALRETRRSDNVIPPSVFATEGYNHIGDISWDAAEGGRILLPLECYYPGTPNGGNSCRTGSIGVADPETLAWRYYVKLDPADIPKAMWNEVSPDGSLLWTSAGDDLLAYRVAELNPANAAPTGAKLRPVRRLADAVPPSGITGAGFFGGRLYVAGQGAGPFQIWSIDLADGSQRLEIERDIVGESEGIDFVDALGGVLHWMVQPFNTEGKPPTYGPSSGALLNFVPASGAGNGSGAAQRMKLSATPRSARAGAMTRFTFRVTGTGSRPVEEAVVTFRGRSARTDETGRARIVARLPRAGSYGAHARRSGMTGATARVRATQRGSPRFAG